LNVDILDAGAIVTRDLRVGPTNDAADVSGTTVSGEGAALKANGDFYVGKHDGNHIFFDQSAGTLAIKSGPSGARTEIVGGTTKVYDASNVVRVIIGDLS
jgi:hypothetical protein